LEKEIVKEGLDFDEKLLCTIFYANKILENIPKQKEYFDKYDKLVVGGAKQLFVKS